MNPRALVALTALAAAAPPGRIAAQGAERDKCIFQNTPTTTMARDQQPSGHYNTYLGRGVFVRCPSKELTLRSDSLESYEADSRLYLIGSVRYNEPRLTLTSRFLTYHQMFERIIATGDVVARLPSGSTLNGPAVEYFRAIPETRPFTRLLATQRPTIHVVQKDSTGAPSDTLVVNADRVSMLGDSIVHASGTVIMTRPEVEARGDSLFIDAVAELMVLMRQPSITGRKGRPFTLTGTRIEITTKNRELERVVAMGKATAVSDDVTLTSDTIDLRVRDDLLDRAIAWGPSRARATSATQTIEADSVDVRLPGQRIRELFAVGAAVALGQPDTARFKADTIDSLHGETIIARFDSVATRDTTRAAQLRELAAHGRARSYYHMTPSDTTIPKAAINYVRGRTITVALKEGRAQRVTVVDSVTGMHLEPKPESRPRP